MLTRHVKERLPKCRLGFTTNGYYLDQNLADELGEYGIDAINISLYTEEERKRLTNIKFSIPVEFREYINTVNQDDRLNCYSVNNNTPAVCLSHAPLYNIIINHNGDVCLCCIDWKYSHTFGNVMDESLMEIVNKEKFIESSELTGTGRQNFECCNNCSGEYIARFPSETVTFNPKHKNRQGE
jgi:MoaA/NifB/PqqE/SkfB family radical SAM enzyme